MNMTDPVADMLTRIRNGVRARLVKIDVPASKLKAEIARILKDEGYIANYRRVDDGRQGALRRSKRTAMTPRSLGTIGALPVDGGHAHATVGRHLPRGSRERRAAGLTGTRCGGLWGAPTLSRRS